MEQVNTEVNVRMLQSPNGDTVSIVITGNPGVKLESQVIVDALCDYMQIAFVNPEALELNSDDAPEPTNE